MSLAKNFDAKQIDLKKIFAISNFNGEIETIRKILLFLYKNQCFAVKYRQSKSKILEFKTLR